MISGLFLPFFRFNLAYGWEWKWKGGAFCERSGLIAVIVLKRGVFGRFLAFLLMLTYIISFFLFFPLTWGCRCR